LVLSINSLHIVHTGCVYYGVKNLHTLITITALGKR
jgi:hypothetical protein